MTSISPKALLSLAWRWSVALVMLAGALCLIALTWHLLGPAPRLTPFWLLLGGQGLLAIGFGAGYAVRWLQPSISISYAGGAPYNTLRIESPRGEGSEFAVAALREILAQPNIGKLAV